ncbi:hypothetical protein YC2023_061290 [Brassica napus]
MRRWSRWSRLPVVQFAAGGVAMILLCWMWDQSLCYDSVVVDLNLLDSTSEEDHLFIAVINEDGLAWTEEEHHQYTTHSFSFAILCLSFELKAGGIVTDASGKALDFSKGKYLDLDTGIIVANEKIINASAFESNS